MPVIDYLEFALIAGVLYTVSVVVFGDEFRFRRKKD